MEQLDTRRNLRREHRNHLLPSLPEHDLDDTPYISSPTRNIFFPVQPPAVCYAYEKPRHRPMNSMDSSDIENDSSSAAPRYEGEDCRPTSKKELLGFYSYSAGAEIVVIAAVSSFMPIALEELARGRGFLQTDRATPCSAFHSTASFTPSNTNGSLRPRMMSPPAKGAQCLVPFLGTEINTASFAMYTFSISVLVQALVVITMSGAADHGAHRKRLLLSFAVIGAVALMLFLPIDSSVYVLGALWAIIANVCLGASFVLLNAYLPLLVRWHPSVQKPSFNLTESVHSDNGGLESRDEDVSDPSAGLLPGTTGKTASSFPAAPSAELVLSTRISSYGIGFGYLAALVVLIFSILIVRATGESNFSLRLVLFFVGCWWVLFTIPAAYCLRPRPGPPIEAANKGISLDPEPQKQSWLSYLTYSWKNLGKTIVRARRLKDVLLFLAAWFMVSDAIATVSGTAILFAKTTLNMKPAALILINIITTTCGVCGAFSWNRVSRALGLTPTRTILACVILFELIPLYGLLGFIPAVRRWGVGGLQQPWEMYPLGAVYGFVLGGLSSYCRSLFGELIPEGSEAAFYALYAVTDKGSSVFGPAIVGAITDATGEIRPAFWFLAALIAVPIIPFSFLDVDRGKREAAALAKEFAGEL
ncbi:autophagy-related protein 22-1 [Myriangium duriaei CBS 260.36]|uniref:Autophagy-related protein n=1 Tax=Myriangium duriaei CBS 260.36 TaxID=1168546 RepID=A0A9P4JBQ1_9PEZI|nr:autophagy-related protein 22-1 [Myriangium duriaei CBS 260.36]